MSPGVRAERALPWRMRTLPHKRLWEAEEARWGRSHCWFCVWSTGEGNGRKVALVRPYMRTLPGVGLTGLPAGAPRCDKGLSPGSAAPGSCLSSQVGNGENLPPGAVVRARCVSVSCDSTVHYVGFRLRTLGRRESQGGFMSQLLGTSWCGTRRLHRRCQSRASKGE